MPVKITSEAKRWQAESDAETLARYQEIMNDAKRKKAAIKMANEKASKLEKAASNMRTAAGNKKK